MTEPSFASQARKGKKRSLQDRFTPKPIAPPPWFFWACGAFAALVGVILVWVLIVSPSPSAEDVSNYRNDNLAQQQPEYVPVPGNGSGSTSSNNDDDATSSSSSSSSFSSSSEQTTTPSKSDSGKSSSSSSSFDLDNPPTDFKSGKKVSVDTYSGGKEKIPAGVRNLAIAGIAASVSGDWDDLPMQSQPSNKTPLKGAEVDKSTFTLLNPGASDTTNTWIFSIRSKSDGGDYTQLRLIVTNTSSGLKLTPPVA